MSIQMQRQYHQNGPPVEGFIASTITTFGLVRMYLVAKDYHPGQTTIPFLPMIDMPPTHMSCVYSQLIFVPDLAARHGTKPILTFDQPWFWKAQVIVDNKPADSHLHSVMLRLGSFHTKLTFLGGNGHHCMAEDYRAT